MNKNKRMGCLVSIIMPVYQVENYIKRSIQSAINQTYKNIEIIVVDDGTKDDSMSVAISELKQAAINSRIIKQENMGIGVARNTGLTASNGEYVYFLDSDDIMEYNAIELLVGSISKNIADFVFSDFGNLEECGNKNIQYTVYEKDDLQRAFLLRDKVVLAPGTLYKRKFLIENELYFAKIPWSEDQHFVWRVLNKMDKAIYINQKLYRYIKRENSIMTSTKMDKIVQGYEEIKKLNLIYDQDSLVGQFLVPRWVIGTLNASSKILEYKDWKRLCQSLDSRKMFIRLLKIPQYKTKLLAFVGVISAKLYYKLLMFR
ncbi:MAG: glycosyltransferase family A protein [Bacillota bacterium]